ncbi:hypothetical protein [Agrobacterium vitis]|uniref:Uncharacterized protein n=1 Tax=Agrobacterium vitis TaxID=373 RepID=A0AAE2RGD9_AGRVI|nr:hypothetical protein [Agrobacterium vitis]MBF2716894.1 hypothetical protein [Agrobacterium vitis]
MDNQLDEIYLPNDLYEAVTNRLVEVLPLLGSRDDLVQRLGEVARIWPAYSQAPREREEFLEAA